MLLAINFARLGPYHLARLRSACEVLGPRGWRVVALEIAGSDATYEWERESAGGDWERVTVFPQEVFEKIPACEMKKGIRKELNRLRPDAVAIAGWGTLDARVCLDWCRRNGAKAIVMSETRAADGRRVWWREWVKSRIVRRFDAALCGGESHKRYLVQLGMPEERIELGYNVVDNQFFGERRNGERRKQGGEADLTKENTEGAAERPGRCGSSVATESKLETGARLSGQAGDAFSNPSTCELAQDSETPSRIRFADAPAPSHTSCDLLPDTETQVPVGPYFLASNRFVERKNLARLIRAYAKYVESFRGSVFRGQHSTEAVWPLVLLGDGELRGKLEGLCGELGIKVFSQEEEGDLKLNSYKLKTSPEEGVVVFAGFRQIEELPAFYAGAGAFVHPALEEPWGLVINEAMASGLPVLSSHNVGAAEELVQEGKTGFLFDPEDVNSMAESLFKMFSMSEPDRCQMGLEAREMLERKVPSRAFGEGLAKVLEA